MLDQSNCFDIARLGKMNEVINHETVQLKIEKVYFGGLSASNRRKNVVSNFLLFFVIIKIKHFFWLSFLSFVLLAPFLLDYREGISLSANGFFEDVLLVKSAKKEGIQERRIIRKIKKKLNYFEKVKKQN